MNARSLLLPVALAASAQSALAAPVSQASAFRLFGGGLALTGNRVSCGLRDIGGICTDPGGSPVNENGFWPAGSRNNYIFNSGLQVAAISSAGDTVGAFFFDPRGDQHHGAPVTPFVDSRATPPDQWPTAARLLDTAQFAAPLIGRNAASQEDSWVRYWDGNTALLVGRKHPMGLLVEQRTMQWNYPVGNEDILYEVFRLVNVSASEPGRYAGLASAGYSAADIAQIAGLGQAFQARMRLDLGISVPDSGWTFAQLYAAYSADHDVGDAGENLTNAMFPLDLFYTYKADFEEPTWLYPAAINAPPFAHAPGFVAEALLKAPDDLPLHFWSQTTGGGAFPDAIGVSQLWRKLSGHFLASDGYACDTPGGNAAALARRFCFVGTTPADVRSYMSFGPLSLAPGQAAVFVMATVFAAPLAAPIAPYVGRYPSLFGGWPLDGTRLAQGLDTVNALDSAMGWRSSADLDGDGAIEANEIVTVPRSLLWKTQLARAVADHGFLLPGSPEAPQFAVVPGDRKVTIAWSKSATEETGDPYFAVASDPLSPLYDPDFRRYDVEGYRVWRGTSPANLEVVAQLDYAGTTFSDYSGQLVRPEYGEKCAPELGVTSSCPAFPYAVPVTSPFVQITYGGRVQLVDSSIAVLHTDTAVTGGASGLPPLRDTGVPFVWVDTSVTNGATYYYAVTAFTVNSYRSAPSSFESARAVKSGTPRLSAPNVEQPQVATLMLGGNGQPLDTAAGWPAIDPNTGTFGGPIPPANAGSVSLYGGVAEAMPVGDYTVRIDSVGPGLPEGIGALRPRLYLSFLADTLHAHVDVAATVGPFNFSASSTNPVSVSGPLVPYDSSLAARLGMSRAFVTSGRMSALFSDVNPSIATRSPAIAVSNGRYGASGTNIASRYLSHSRWFDEGASEPPDPTIDFNPSRANNSGLLTGVDSIWAPEAYRVPSTGAGATAPQISATARAAALASVAWYPADFVVTWGAGGTIAVRDSTHRTDLPFATHMGTGYGFISLDSIAAAGVTDSMLGDGTRTASVTRLDYHSLYSVRPVCDQWWLIPCAGLAPKAVLQPLDLNSDGTADGQGFILIVNGEPFMMKLASLPAAGTRWHLRAVGGAGMNASCTPALTSGMTTAPGDCSSYTWNPPPARPALAPGLRFVIRVSRAYTVLAASGDLSRVHTVPDPFYRTTPLEALVGTPRITFVNLPDRCVIRIYSSSGILVTLLTHNDPSGGGELPWDVTNRNGHQVASGVYFWHIVTPDGQRRVGRFTVVTGQR